MRKNRVRFIQWRRLHSPWRHYGRWGCAEDVARTWAKREILTILIFSQYKRNKRHSNLHHHRYGYEWRVGRESSHTAQIQWGGIRKGSWGTDHLRHRRQVNFTPSFSIFVILFSDGGRPLNVVLGIFSLDRVVTLCQCFRIDWTPVGWWNGCSE